MNAWITRWKVPESATLTSTQSDYRDILPRRPEELAEQLADVVQVCQACLHLQNEGLVRDQLN